MNRLIHVDSKDVIDQLPEFGLLVLGFKLIYHGTSATREAAPHGRCGDYSNAVRAIR